MIGVGADGMTTGYLLGLRLGRLRCGQHQRAPGRGLEHL